jgi:hypothetical protein
MQEIKTTAIKLGIDAASWKCDVPTILRLHLKLWSREAKRASCATTGS